MPAKLGSLVERATSAFGARLSSASQAHIAIWLDRLSLWNERMDLTAARSPEELVDLSLADALFLTQHVPRSQRLVDVGSGAGAPGLPIALLREDLRVTLVEPTRKRTSFLRSVLGETGRIDVEILASRGEAMIGRRTWDTAVSRATLNPAEWLALGAQLVPPGGHVWTLLAREAPPAHPKTAAEADFAYAWPLTGAARRAILYSVRA
jgi:16S rRNA (guanine527-N7)-methyltransferase